MTDVNNKVHKQDGVRRLKFVRMKISKKAYAVSASGKEGGKRS